MRIIKILLSLIAILGITNTVISQNSERSFNEILHTYYLEKDDNLVSNSIEFFNHTNPNNKSLEHIITGFYGGLFLKSSEIKKEFKLNIEKFENDNIKYLFSRLIENDIEKIMKEHPVLPSLNDMNWSAFFSTGDSKYLEVILKNTLEAQNRIDLNLFLTGASAKWSLCSNSQVHKKVKEFLESNTQYKEQTNQILNNRPLDLKNKMIEIIKEQRSKGVWN